VDGAADEHALDVQGLFSIPLAELRAAWQPTLRRAFAD
jgi:hypothetical protein